MAAKIYDSTQQAFVDAEVPKVNDGNAYVDSQGMSYDSGAWKEDWNSKIQLLNGSYENINITGGFEIDSTSGTASLTKGESGLSVIGALANNGIQSRWRTKDYMNLSSYKKLVVEFIVNSSTTGNGGYVVYLVRSDRQNDISDGLPFNGTGAGKHSVEMDLSAMNDISARRLWVGAYASGSSVYVNVTFNRIYLV